MLEEKQSQPNSSSFFPRYPIIIGIVIGVVIGVLTVLLYYSTIHSNSPKAEDLAIQPKENDPMSECEKAVRDQYSVSYQSPYSNSTPRPPMKVYGVSLVKMRNETSFVVAADLEKPDKSRTIHNLLCQRYTGEGKTYWKAQE